MKRLLLFVMMVMILAPMVVHAQSSYATSLQNTINFLSQELQQLQAKLLSLQAELAGLTNTPPPPPPTGTGTTSIVTATLKYDARIHCSSSPNWGTNGTYASVDTVTSCGPWVQLEDADGDEFHQLMPRGGVIPVLSLMSENYQGTGYFHMWRVFMEFDTSVVPVGATINSIQLKLTPYSWFYNDDHTSMGVYDSFVTRLDNTLGHTDWNLPPSSLVTPDYSACGTTSYSNLPFASWNTSGSNLLGFNTQGLTLLPAQSLKLCLRTALDVNVTPPYGRNEVFFHTMEDTDSSTWPQLIVTYTF